MITKYVACALLMSVFAVAPANAQFAPGGELRVMRADYFENYAGSFLAVEVFDDQVSADGNSGPTVSLAWRTATGSYGPATTIPRYRDIVPSLDTYLYNRTLVRIGAAGVAADPPVMIRVTSSTGAAIEVPVRPSLVSAGPPQVPGYLRGFAVRYLDPTEVAARITALAGEFSGVLAGLVNLPHPTPGYRRRATTIMGVSSTPYAGATEELPFAEGGKAVVLQSIAYGNEGGNNLFATFRDPLAANSPLSVVMSGAELTVNLATNASGALSSTPAQVVAAINAHPGASAVLRALSYRAGAATGIAQATTRSQLSDWLNAPPHVARAPFQMRALRIGKFRDGTKVAVFIYCQQRARDWVTPLTCLETAERLLRNYGTDPWTTTLLDNLEIFIVPSANPDGSHYSMYDSSDHRRNMNYQCTFDHFRDPVIRNSIGVNLDRNNTVGTLLDGYAGASGDCLNNDYAGPFESSEAETRNLQWVVDTFPNIKFSLNIQSDGGLFMWSPGAYTPFNRTTLPQPNVGLNAFHFAAAEYILSRVKAHRGTAILPENVGPGVDVRGSEAGNSTDDQWYRKGVFAYTMAVGAERFQSTSVGVLRNPVGTQPNFATEGIEEVMEFANGAIGLVDRALAYAQDVTPPSVDIAPNGGSSATPVTATFNGNEPATIYYTLDGSTPTLASPTWEAARPRLPGSAFLFTQSTTVKWIAADVKGNLSAVRTAQFVIDTAPPVSTAQVSPTAVNGWHVSATATLSATDGTGVGVNAIHYRIDGGAWTTYAGPFAINGDGVRTLEYYASDLVGNTEAVKSRPVQIDSTQPVITVTTPAAGASYSLGSTVAAAYTCTDASSGVTQCAGSVASGAPIDTTTVGPHAFVVNAQDAVGHTRQVAVAYSVVNAPVQLTLDKTELRFAAVTNGAAFVTRTASQTVRLTQSGAGAISWTATPTQPWLTVSPSSGIGSQTLTISVAPANGLPASGSVTGAIAFSFTASNTPVPINVHLTLVPQGTSLAPFGNVDTPTNNRTGVTGAVPFTGWALDDIEVTRVMICRAAFGGEVAPIDPNCGSTAQIFVGFGGFIDGARPDVQGTFPSYPLSTRAGWGFMVLTNMLPNQGNGTYHFTIWAEDRDGHTVVLDTRTITCANASATLPFGTIDTPAQSGIASGSSFVNFGWALTPLPKTIPINGSTIQVLIDGVSVGNADYNHARPDIQAAFPGLNNSNGAIGFRILDTTTLTNGLHTISWTVTDDQGATEGIGSRFFTVQNGVTALTAAATSALVDVESVTLDTAPLEARTGWDLTAPYQSFAAGSAGTIVIRTEEVGRVELLLGSGEHTGYLRVGDELAPLPVGSRIDPGSGQFTWAPGAGFIGQYDLVFVRSIEGQGSVRRDVRIVLQPKGVGTVGPR